MHFRIGSWYTLTIYASAYRIAKYWDLLAGIILGRKLGSYQCHRIFTISATGLPVLSGGRGGIGVFAGPSAGFLFLYPFIAYFIGLVRSLFWKINFGVLLVATLIIGVLVLDIFGTIIMGFIIHIPVF